MSVLQQLYKQSQKNEAVFLEFYQRIDKAMTEKGIRLDRDDALLGLHGVATLKEEDVDAAMEQPFPARQAGHQALVCACVM